ncbi:VOC family protein [Pelomonas sp. PFR6]|uniref:VOC family protein n=1 Tax=Roseateles violae TaxID=3058042 RepID=A0ABT8DSX4_9BURK|nr:VOC family protein [Pelomonas sp. PFR6]MDN3921415.1 VOC family protein [Pelomonas sp. PFR6]
MPPARGAIPYLVIKDAAAAIAFYQQVFGAEQLLRLDAPDGKPMHAELRVGPASFMLTEERPEYGALSPLTIGGSATTSTLYVPDADAVFGAALAAGAQQLMPVMDQFWGDRSGALSDPFGHKWMIATHKEEPSEDELRRRLAAMMAGMPNVRH